ncbi:MAG: hypothetical protein RIQ51_1132 [Bacteroidota bacterium]|jgi:hypothetical protein
MKAFPHNEIVEFIDGEITPKITPPFAGMDLRDYFAAKAMQSFINTFERTPEQVANLSYKYADVMMKVRNK